MMLMMKCVYISPDSEADQAVALSLVPIFLSLYAADHASLELILNPE